MPVFSLHHHIVCNIMENVVQFFNHADFCQHFWCPCASKFVESHIELGRCCQIEQYFKICQHFLKNMLANLP